MLKNTINPLSVLTLDFFLQNVKKCLVVDAHVYDWFETALEESDSFPPCLMRGARGAARSLCLHPPVGRGWSSVRSYTPPPHHLHVTGANVDRSTPLLWWELWFLGHARNPNHTEGVGLHLNAYEEGWERRGRSSAQYSDWPARQHTLCVNDLTPNSSLTCS